MTEEELQAHIELLLKKPDGVGSTLIRAMAHENWPKIKAHVLKYGIHGHRPGMHTWHFGAEDAAWPWGHGPEREVVEQDERPRKGRGWFRRRSK